MTAFFAITTFILWALGALRHLGEQEEYGDEYYPSKSPTKVSFTRAAFWFVDELLILTSALLGDEK